VAEKLVDSHHLASVRRNAGCASGGGS
jgi:hypothetical protein